MFDLFASRALVAQSIGAASLTANTNGTGVDLQQSKGNALFVVNCGLASAGTTPTMNFKVQDSADNSSFADVTGGAFPDQVTDSLKAGSQMVSIAKDKLRRYARIVATIGGTSSPAFPAAGMVLFLQ